MNRTAEAEVVLGNLVTAVHMLENCPEFTSLIPEVRVNLAYALPNAKITEDVAAVEGRITAVHGHPSAAGMPAWGASDHLAIAFATTRRHRFVYG
jgi:predicted fused transcriptional regulator/phosphomethylpyrimidine kinase